MDFDAMLEQAMAIAQERMPNASSQHKAAFANTAAELVTHISGGYGGPSVRQHVAIYSLSGRRWSFDEAVEELIKPDGWIFGQLKPEHHAFWEEQSDQCFDDDPNDVAFLDGDPRLN